MRVFMIASLALALTTGSVLADTRPVSGFDTVSASGRFDVEVAVGPAFEVVVTGEDAGRIRTRVEDGALKIEPVNRPWFGNPAYDARVRVTLPRLAGVAAARGARVGAVAGGECRDFSAAAAMGADLNVTNIACARVEAAAAMGADISLSGACEALEVAAAMGGEVDAEALRCGDVDASAAMGGNVSAHADTRYDANAAMGGDISLAGDASKGERSATMGGTITHTQN